MRKTSQDGGDATFATSGVENEIKKPKAGLLLEFKSKKVGKRMAPNLSEESDDAVVEPLLQKTTDKTIQSAKYLAKAKADTVKEISKLFNDKKSQYASTSGTTEPLLSEKDQSASKPNVPCTSTNAPLHNYMNTNIFHSHDNSKANGTTKSQLLVEIDGSKQSEYNPSPLIFTTAKIHMDGKSSHMEPVQMTPAPIVSTLEVSVSRSGSIKTNEKKVSNGTSIMNTLYSQPHEKTNNVNISNSNVLPVTQSKDKIMTDKTCNPVTKSITTNANSFTEISSQVNEKIKESTPNILNSKLTSVANVNDKTTNSSKSFTTLPNHPLENRSPPETSKQMTPVDPNNKPSLTQHTKDTKKLIDEPRILMSESKLKSTFSDNSKNIASVKTTTQQPLQKTNVLEASMKQTEISQSNKNEKVISNSDNDTKVKNMDIKDSQPKNIQSSTEESSKELATKSNTKLTKSQQKNTTAVVGAASISSKKSECDPSAKTMSSSTKIPTQSKVIDSKLSKEIIKSPKPSANEVTKTKSKISLNNTASSSINKIPTSASITKPASKVISSTVTDTSSNSLLSNSKAITTASSTTSSSNALKNPSTSTKTVSSTVTKPTSVTSTKSPKASSVSSIKSPQIISTPTTLATKPLNTSTAKTALGKPSLASTKTPQVNTSSPVTSPTAKMVSKIAQVSTSNSTGNTSSTVAPSSSATVEASNKAKAPESNKKGGSKQSGNTKDTKVSNA